MFYSTQNDISKPLLFHKKYSDYALASIFAEFVNGILLMITIFKGLRCMRNLGYNDKALIITANLSCCLLPIISSIGLFLALIIFLMKIDLSLKG